MIDLENYTNTVVKLACELIINWTHEERKEIFDEGSVPAIFRKYTVAHIKEEVEKSA